jgi:PAS domain S-box-containing protein
VKQRRIERTAPTGIVEVLTNPIIDRIPYMVWTYDRLGTPEFVNAFWTTYTGLSFADTAESGSWRSLLEVDDYDSFVGSLQDAMANGVVFSCEARLRRHLTGEYRWHVVCVKPDVADDGTIVSWTGTATDIEDRKRAEAHALGSEAQCQQERATSTLFQQSLLPPRLPTVPGLSFDAVYETGVDDAQVGGDWYDAFRLIDGRVLLTIGDVSGSGLSAAVIMGIVRQIMRGIAQLHAEPALMLDAADRALRLEYPEVFVTAWVGILDLVGRTLTYTAAGHPPPLLVEANGDVRELNHRTLPIGLRQGHQGHAATVALSHGSALWLYTDGLIEAAHNIEDGTRRLHEVASRLGSAKIAHPAATIRRLVIPDGSPDDVAILVVQTNFDESERHLARSHFDSADALAARKARRAFMTSLSPKHFSENDIANAEVVFGELCGNIARYAPGPIEVIVDSSGVQAVLHVLDRGAGFRHISRLPVDPLSEEGRGLFIIASMTTEFTVSQRSGGGSHARAVLVGRYPVSLLRDETLPAVTDQVAAIF